MQNSSEVISSINPLLNKKINTKYLGTIHTSLKFELSFHSLFPMHTVWLLFWLQRASPEGPAHGQLIDNHRPGVPFHGFLCIYDQSWFKWYENLLCSCLLASLLEDIPVSFGSTLFMCFYLCRTLGTSKYLCNDEGFRQDDMVMVRGARVLDLLRSYFKIMFTHFWE